MESIPEKQFLWEYLRQADRPIVIYGMGDGCEKIHRVCENYGVPVAGIFASDEYVRGHSFLGYPVLRYEEAEKRFGPMIVLLAFAAFEPGLVGKIKRIAAGNELYAPDVPLFGGDLFDRSFFEAHIKKFEAVYNVLADELSRHVFRSVLSYKISGKPEYLYECETPKEEAYRRILTLGSRECYADLGAYDGDTVTEFLQIVQNRYQRVYAFEPNRKNFKKLSRSLQGAPDIRLLQNGVWNKRAVLNFNAKAGRSSAVDPAAQATIEALPVDEAVSEPLTYIKFDVEGVEREALEGCRRQVQTYMPKLAVSAYHRTCDLFAIPEQVLSYRPEYRVFLRHHPYVPAWDTLYYFVP